MSDRYLKPVRNEGVCLCYTINRCYFLLMNTVKYSIVAMIIHTVKSNMNWTKGAVNFKSLFKNIFSIRDFYFQRRDTQQKVAFSRLKTNATEAPHSPDMGPARGETALRKCDEELQGFALSCHEVLNQTCFDREKVRTLLLTCLSPTLPIPTEN